MTHDDIHNRAVDLIRSHGTAAGLEAAMRADEALERGDQDAHQLWIAIMKLIMQIERINPEAMVQ